MGLNPSDAGPTVEAELLACLSAAVADATHGLERVSLLFSGGLDSSLLAYLLPADLPATLVTIGTPGAADLEAARDAALRLGRSLDIHALDPPEIQAAWQRWEPELGAVREPTRSVAFAFLLAMGAAPSGPVLCGQGADELFYGYAHFRGLSIEAARRRSTEDLAALERVEWPRAVRIGRSLGREPRAPYLDIRVRAAAAEFAPPVPGEPPKVALRRVAALAGLPTELVERPKRALQYGSGVSKALEKVIRRAPARGLPPGSPPPPEGRGPATGRP
jgi:asparagine synthase (glutamine-hydrolysing)